MRDVQQLLAQVAAGDEEALQSHGPDFRLILTSGAKYPKGYDAEEPMRGATSGERKGAMDERARQRREGIDRAG